MQNKFREATAEKSICNLHDARIDFSQCYKLGAVSACLSLQCQFKVCTHFIMDFFFRVTVLGLCGRSLNFYRRGGKFFFSLRNAHAGGQKNGKLFCIFWSCCWLERNANVLDIVGLQVYLPCRSASTQRSLSYSGQVVQVIVFSQVYLTHGSAKTYRSLNYAGQVT